MMRKTCEGGAEFWLVPGERRPVSGELHFGIDPNVIVGVYRLKLTDAVQILFRQTFEFCKIVDGDRCA